MIIDAETPENDIYFWVFHFSFISLLSNTQQSINWAFFVFLLETKKKHRKKRKNSPNKWKSNEVFFIKIIIW